MTMTVAIFLQKDDVGWLTLAADFTLGLTRICQYEQSQQWITGSFFTTRLNL